MNRTTRVLVGVIAVLVMAAYAAVRVGAQSTNLTPNPNQQLNQAPVCVGGTCVGHCGGPTNQPPLIEVRTGAQDAQGTNGLNVTANGIVGVGYDQTVASVGFWIRVTDPNSDPCSLQATITPAIGSGADAMDIHEWDTWAGSSYQFLPVAFVKYPIIAGKFTVPDIDHDVTLLATDTSNATFTFQFKIHVGPIPNQDPVITVTQGGAVPIAVPNGSQVQAYYTSDLADLQLAITVDDPNVGQQVSLSASIDELGGSGVGTTGILESEFSSSSAPVAYQVFPTSGNFDAPGVTYRVILQALDNHATNPKTFQFIFDIVVSSNRLPTLAVSIGGVAVADTETRTVPFGSSIAGLNIVITADDLDGDNCAVSAVLTNTTLQSPPHPLAQDPSILPVQTEFEVNPPAAVPNNYSPLTGLLDAHFGSTHLVELTIQDALGATRTFSFTIAASPEANTAEIEVRTHSLGGAIIVDNAPASGDLDFGARDIQAGPSVALTICVINNGDIPLNLGTPVLAGADSAEFTISLGGFTNVVAVGGFTFFQVAFDPGIHVPGVTNPKFATIGIPHDGWNDFILADDLFAIQITGEAVDGGFIDITSSPVLNDATIGLTYSSPALTAAGGVPPYTWSVVGTQPPAGIVLTPAGYLLGGASGPAGNYSFTVRCTDTLGNFDVQVFNINVVNGGPPPAGPGPLSGGGGGGCATGAHSAPWLMLAAVGASVALLRRRRKQA